VRASSQGEEAPNWAWSAAEGSSMPADFAAIQRAAPFLINAKSDDLPQEAVASLT
jgi:hypothetical protein